MRKYKKIITKTIKPGEKLEPEKGVKPITGISRYLITLLGMLFIVVMAALSLLAAGAITVILVSLLTSFIGQIEPGAELSIVYAHILMGFTVLAGILGAQFYNLVYRKLKMLWHKIRTKLEKLITEREQKNSK